MVLFVSQLCMCSVTVSKTIHLQNMPTHTKTHVQHTYTQFVVHDKSRKNCGKPKSEEHKLKNVYSTQIYDNWVSKILGINTQQ